MRFNHVYRIIFVKEFRELIRDRRALFWLFAPPIVLPMIALCAILFISIQTVKIADEGFPILIENGAQAPDLVRWLEAEGNIRLVDAPPHPEQDPFGEAILIVSLPPDFEKQLQETHSTSIELITRDNAATTLLGQSLVQAIIESYSDDLLDQRLSAQGLTREWLNPIQIKEGRRVSTESVAVASDQEGGGSFLSTLFLPLVVTSWMLGGGIGLIVDTTVGEKERKTIENLLVTPASRAGVVMGKMTVVFIASMAVLGLWLAEGLLISTLSAAAPALAEMESLGTSQIVQVLLESSGNVLKLILALLVLVVPFTAMLNSLVIAWCAYAANYREANLFMILLQLALPASVLLTIFSLPARISLGVYAIPFFGTIVAIRDLFGSALPPLGLTINFVTALVYAAASVGLAAWMFNQEWSLTRGI
jgi:sodium transport system permease protein